MASSSSLIPGLADDIAELCLSRIPRSSFQILSQVCWRWRRFLRSEHYGAVRKLTGSVEELMCVLVDDEYWEVFDCSGNKLGRIPPVPGPLKGDGLVVLDGGKIVFIGGRYNSAASADVYELNPATNRWRKLADMNIPRYNFGYAVADGLLYVIRGLSSDDVSILNAEVYNPKTNQWSLMDCPHRPNFVRGFAFSFSSKLFVAGNESSFIDIYDPKEETWEELDSERTLSVSSYTVVRDKVYFKNMDKPGISVFDPDKSSWSSVWMPTIPGRSGTELGQWNNKVIIFARGFGALGGDLDRENAAVWRATPIILSSFEATSVLINI
ncbi:hypothetical protein BRARA_H02178 [Brassica rapa]|uniref:F-box domain-containing protein n=1 Tax=Brassica campestris TaxID=3711 RepID=A0A397YNK4_BRACM|nr:hypothetical protein BRARA_H02178 [Brassica rapa]